MSGALLVSAALTACSDAPKSKTTTSPSTSSGSVITSTQSPTGSSAAALKDAKGAVKALSGFTCAATGQTWSAKGTLTNSGKATATYVVRAAVVKPKTFTVLGQAEQRITLESGRHTEVSMAKIYSGSGKDLLCVPTVVTVGR